MDIHDPHGFFTDMFLPSFETKYFYDIVTILCINIFVKLLAPNKYIHPNNNYHLLSYFQL